MIVSVFTDASVNPELKKCGFAFYIGCKAGKIQKAGRLKIECSESYIAELHTIANAIYTVKHCKFEPISKVFIYSDSKHVLGALSGDNRNHRSKEVREVLQEVSFLMMEICLKHGRSVRDVKTFFEFVHVKAHTGKQDKFSRINDWCDAQAKKYMRLACKEVIVNN